jgi:hypothetical protein
MDSQPMIYPASGFQRLVPVSATDACLFRRNGLDPLELELPRFPREASELSPAERRVAMSKAHGKVLASSLYVIVPPLAVRELPRQLWNADLASEELVHIWACALYPAGYRPLLTSVATYRQTVDVLPTQLGIFGAKGNALGRVIAMANSLGKVSVLLHYVCAVVLQFYLSARGLFLEVRTDRGAPFSEALPPYLFFMFRRLHWLCDLKAPEVHSPEDAASQVMLQTFPTFLFQVLRWMQFTWPDEVGMLTRFHTTKDHVERFCAEKLRKNFLQALMCMRFREVMPVNLCEAVNQSRSEGDTDGPAQSSII